MLWAPPSSLHPQDQGTKQASSFMETCLCFPILGSFKLLKHLKSSLSLQLHPLSSWRHSLESAGFSAHSFPRSPFHYPVVMLSVSFNTSVFAKTPFLFLTEIHKAIFFFREVWMGGKLFWETVCPIRLPTTLELPTHEEICPHCLALPEPSTQGALCSPFVSLQVTHFWPLLCGLLCSFSFFHLTSKCLVASGLGLGPILILPKQSVSIP